MVGTSYTPSLGEQMAEQVSMKFRTQFLTFAFHISMSALISSFSLLNPVPCLRSRTRWRRAP